MNKGWTVHVCTYLLPKFVCFDSSPPVLLRVRQSLHSVIVSLKHFELLSCVWMRRMVVLTWEENNVLTEILFCDSEYKTAFAQTPESCSQHSCLETDYLCFLFSFFISYSMTECVLVTGIITSFGLWLDGVQILNSSSTQRFFVVDRLDPWSQHVLRLQACTAQGCGKGPMVSTTPKH